jgi:hypothetical protein
MKKKKLYHISNTDLGETQMFYPRIPQNRFEGDSTYHPYLGESFPENDTVKRICVSDSIEGCILATDSLCGTAYIYVPRHPKHVTRDMPLYMVPDARETGEHWILNKTLMVKLGSIEIIYNNYKTNEIKYKWLRKYKI